MNAISWYVMSSSWVFLVGWVVVLLVAGWPYLEAMLAGGELLFSANSVGLLNTYEKLCNRGVR